MYYNKMLSCYRRTTRFITSGTQRVSYYVDSAAFTAITIIKLLYLSYSDCKASKKLGRPVLV